MENKPEALSEAADPSELSSDGVNLGWQSEITEQEEAESPSFTDALKGSHFSGASIGASENSEEVTKVRRKPVVIETSSNLLLGEGRDKNGEKKQESEESKEPVKSDLSKAKLRRLDDSSELVDHQPKKEKEKGVSSLTRRRLDEFRAPGQVAEMPSDIVMNVDSLEKSLKDVERCDELGKAVKKADRKSSSGNLLSFVTKMKFDTTKLKVDTGSDPFKQDDLDFDFDLGV